MCVLAAGEERRDGDSPTLSTSLRSGTERTVPVGQSEIQFSGIAEVAVKVSDAVRSDRFYREVLGFDPLPGKTRYAVNDDQTIEIVASRADGADHRLAHFTLATGDVRSAREVLMRRGVEVTAISKAADGSLRCTLSDPDGNRILLMQAATMPRRKAPGARPISTHLRHAGIQVADLDTAAKFYHDKLGLEPERLQHGKTRWINMQLPGGDYIQMQLAPENGLGDRRWTFEHFGLDVQDAHAAYQELQKRGVPPGPRFEPVVGYAGRLKINFADPDNTLVELMELGSAKATERREP
jgi:catechol 2,3-dioxygenase-like lactoylglutathione lyase family enzyme